MFLAEIILILGFWLFVLISELRGFLLLVFALAIKVGALSVHLLSWVSVLFSFSFLGGWGGGGVPLLFSFSIDSFFSELMVSEGLRSVGGLLVASGRLMQTPLGLFVLASGWLVRSQWVAFVNSIGFICYSQWVVSTDSIGIFCSLL